MVYKIFYNWRRNTVIDRPGVTNQETYLTFMQSLGSNKFFFFCSSTPCWKAQKNKHYYVLVSWKFSRTYLVLSGCCSHLCNDSVRVMMSTAVWLKLRCLPWSLTTSAKKAKKQQQQFRCLWRSLYSVFREPWGVRSSRIVAITLHKPQTPP